MNTPTERISIIENSMQCLSYGRWSLVPLLGFPMLILTARKFHRIRIQSAGEWNAGQRLAKWGMILASIGGFISLLLYGWIFVLIVQAI